MFCLSFKVADVISFNLAQPSAELLYDIYAQLVYAMKGDVTNVMVHGKFIVKNKKVLTLNQEEILAKAEEYRKSISLSSKNATGKQYSVGLPCSVIDKRKSPYYGVPTLSLSIAK